MELIGTQRWLARLSTDQALRVRFLANPVEVGAKFGFAPEEARNLATFSGLQVDSFAGSLVRKRRGAVRRLLPETSRRLGGQFAAAFQTHARDFLPQGLHRHIHDAIAFAMFLTRQSPALPAEIVASARYETGWLRFRLGRRWPLVMRLEEDPRVRESVNSAPERARRVLALWFRFAGRVRNFIVRFV